MTDHCRQHFLQGILALFLCFCLTACISLPFGSKMAPPSTPAVAEARKAWDAKNMSRAEKLYAALIRTSGITLAEKQEAYSRHAIAAARNGNPNKGMKSLNTWLKEDPKARALPGWQDAWFACVRAYTPSRTISSAKAIWHEAHAPDGLRLYASFILTSRSFSVSQIIKTAGQMNTLYAHMERNRQATFEQQLLLEVRFITSSVLADIIKQIPAGRDKHFPYSIFLLEQARRLAKNQPDQSAQLLARIRNAFADKNLIDNTMLSTSPQGGCVVLALPISGPVSPIGRKVSAGARLAQQELAQKGVQVQLEILNTESPDWLTKLTSLPPECVMVGGPLQTRTFQQMKEKNALSSRAVFAFTPQLNDNDEGRIAWRFFTSQQDQIDAVIRVAYTDLGLRSFGAFYPEDDYGKRMTSLFTQGMQQYGQSVHAVNYDPEASITWTDTAAQLLKDSNGEIKQPDAVFLPDSWKKMDSLTKSFQYYGAKNMVMLGTALWEHRLSDRFISQIERYALAIFPAAWNPDNVPAALSAAGKADFWKGLGYDFMRFAAQMNLNKLLSPTEITAKARNTQINWSIAPLSWDAQGKAHQTLFMFTPTSQGMKLLDVDSFKLLRQNVLSSTPAPVDQPLSEQGQTNLPTTTQPLSSTPHPSYKLQLPGAR